MAVVFQIVLWIWFFGCIITYRFGRWVLVEGMGIRSAEFIMLCLYSIGLLLRFLFPPIGRWALLAVLLFWLVVQFFCHWYYTVFGASERKLTGYNECFKNTVRLFPMSEKRLVPDLYHIFLHVFILINIIFCFAEI